MNADAYLRKQGWKGSGHSLDTTGRGLKKPLLLAHKQDQLGLGKKKAAYTTDDQWWMRAYDQSLQNIGTGKESTLNQIRTQGINRGGLYGFFVKGEPIQGTIEDASATATDASTTASGTSTPPTSASETEAASTAIEDDYKRKTKRKRGEIEVSGSSKKSKKTKKTTRIESDVKLTVKPGKKSVAIDPAKQIKPAVNPSNKEHAAVTKKLAKMQPAEKAEYEARAAEKGQTLKQYVLRRIQKKDEQRASKYDVPSFDSAFFIDLEGDRALTHESNTANPHGHFAPHLGCLLPLGLQPTEWERQILEGFNTHGKTRADLLNSEKPPPAASSIKTFKALQSAGEPDQSDVQERSRYHLRSTKVELQLLSTDPSGDASDDLEPAACEQLDDLWAMETADVDPKVKNCLGEYRDTAMRDPEPERRTKIKKRGSQSVQYARGTRGPYRPPQAHWEIRFDC